MKQEIDEFRWRHKRTGRTYTEVGRGYLQLAVEGDTKPMVVYRSDTDGCLVCRPTDEFMDGRFEQIAPASKPELEQQPNRTKEAERDASIVEDDIFARELKEAIRVAGVHGSMEPYARVLSGRLRQMDKRAKAANRRADDARADITRLTERLAMAGESLHPGLEAAAKWHYDQLIDGHCGEDSAEIYVRQRANRHHLQSAKALRAMLKMGSRE